MAFAYTKLMQAMSAVGIVTDPDFEYVTMLLPGNGTNGAQNNTFIDSSTNNFTITRNGNTTQGTFSPYGDNWSNYFDGSGDYLQVTGSSNLAFGTGDFTVEMWLYMTTAPSGNAYTLYDSRPANTNGNYLNWFIDTSSKLGVYINSSTIYTSTGTISTNTWTHIAVSRSGTSLRVFINGTQDGSTVTNSTDLLNGTNRPIIAQQGFDPSGGTNWFPGYISNLRALKGTAQYTANFTPPTAPLTAITNTSLLTCQSNRFIDNSTNAFAITRNGDVSVQRFSPFSPTAAYASGTIGGSGYFDGTGDYLTTSGTNSAWALGTGDFQISFWLYPQSVSGFRDIFTQQNIGGTPQIFLVNNALRYNNAGIAAILDATTSIRVNEWVYCVLSRVSGTTRWFINGAAAGSVSDSNNWSNTNGWYVSTSAQPYQGYIADLRLVKGSGVTSSTVPTVPDTAIANTQFLTNFTNAGIIDNAMMNDLETVGNAQISTTQSKFGGSSMYFDGSGDYLVTPSSQQYVFGTGNFTVECWVYFNGAIVDDGIFHISPTQVPGNTTTGIAAAAYATGGSQKWALFAKGVQTDSALTTISTGVWYHVAVVRNGTTTTLYVNGSSVATASSDTTDYTQSYVFIGGYYGSGFLIDGYIDDLRITKGVARYTANFTAPTAAFPTS